MGQLISPAPADRLGCIQSQHLSDQLATTVAPVDMVLDLPSTLKEGAESKCVEL
jgi:hypothetical protein